MVKADLKSVVVAHANGGERIKGGELVLPELRLVSGGAALGTVEVDISKGRGGAQIVSVGSPLVGVGGLGCAFAHVVIIGEERKDVLEVGDGGHRRVDVASVLVDQRREFGPRPVVIPSALRIGVIDGLGEIQLLQQMAAHAANVGGLQS